MQLRLLRRRDDIFVTHWQTQRDIFAHRAGGDKRILHHHTHIVAQTLLIDFTQVMPIQQNFA